MPEAVIDSETGLLVPHEYVDLLSDAMIQLVKDVDPRNRLGAEGHAEVKNFSWPVIAEEYLNIYCNVIQR